MTFYSWDFDCGISYPLWGLEYMSVEKKNCDKIEKRLCVNGFKVNVSRHTLFDIRYFLVENPNADVSLNQSDIVDALDIPNDWVCLYKMNGLKEVYAIKEKELVDKYGDCDGELRFTKFDLSKVILCSNPDGLIKKQLKREKVKINSDVICNLEEEVIYLFKCHNASFMVANALNIPHNAVVDISDMGEDMTHIIILDRCK